MRGSAASGGCCSRGLQLRLLCCKNLSVSIFLRCSGGSLCLCTQVCFSLRLRRSSGSRLFFLPSQCLLFLQLLLLLRLRLLVLLMLLLLVLQAHLLLVLELLLPLVRLPRRLLLRLVLQPRRLLRLQEHLRLRQHSLG